MSPRLENLRYLRFLLLEKILFRCEGGNPPSPTSLRIKLRRVERLRRGCQSNPLPWSKRINDFFEAGIAAQGIPHRIQAQVAISVGARSFGEGFKLPKRQFAFACPRTDDGKAGL